MPSHIGKYEVIRRLGQGAMGEVFLAKDPLIGREVAIKTIAPGQAQGEEARERFLREARAAGALGHPNLVTIHEFGEDQSLLYLVMEYVPGEDLHALLMRRELRPREVLEILAQVCDGLGYAHQRGVLHRDIKPSNIRVARTGGKWFAKVMDFGIARIAGSDFTGTGTLLGTFGYMAPEYIQTGRPNPRSDLFAVGVILYEALSGERPFQGETTATILYRIVHDTPPALDLAVLDGVSPAVQAILSLALAKDPQRRFQSAEEMAEALRSATDPSWRGLKDPEATVASTRSAPPAAAPTERAALPRPRRWGAWVAAALAAIGLAGAGLLIPRWNRPVPQRSAQAPPAATPPAQVVAPEPQATPLPAKVLDPPAATPLAPAKEAAPRPPAGPPPSKPAAPKAPPGPSVASLDEAAAIVEKDPKAALAFLQRFLAEDPRNARAYALKMVAHYDLGDVESFVATSKEMQAQGVPRRLLLAYPRFRQMLQQEQENPKLPPRLRQHLEEAAAASRRQELSRRRRPESP